MLQDEELEAEGTKLWNVCTRLSRENTAKSSAGLKLVLWSRVLAFQVLHLCQWSAECDHQTSSHLLGLALRVVKLCIDDEDVQNARFVLQKAADYHGRLQSMSQTMQPGDADQAVEKEAEWTVLRIALAWRENQLDVAEHLFPQASDLMQKINPVSASNIINTYFQIGRGMLLKGDLLMAEKWLQRAWDAINSQRLQELPRDAVELRMAILQSIVTALLGLQTSEGSEKAHNLVRYVESEVGDQPIVLLLNLEILNRSPAEVFDSEGYGNILRRMIRSLQPSESSFKILAHHIRQLHDKSPGLGCAILDDFLSSLIKTGQQIWIDKAVVTRIFMTTSQRDFAGSIDEAEKALSKLEPISPDASFSALALILRKVEANYNQGQYEMAERWCRLALSPAFSNSGPLNSAKIQRKLLLCALARNDVDSAKSTFCIMSRDAQKDPMTQYLMYKTAVRSGDRESAAEHLEAVAKASPEPMQLLYACVRESTQINDRLISIDALKKVADVCDLQRPGQVHLPALLRCTIKLLLGLLDSGEEAQRQSVINDLCAAFDAAATEAHKSPEDASGKKLFDVRELEWFCQNSYNLGLKHAGDWSLQNVVEILTACVRFIQAFPTGMGAEVVADLSLKSIFCNFLISSALVALVRPQDNLEEQLQRYLLIRRHIAAADTSIQERMESQSLDEVASRDLLSKLALLLAFDFEAAVALKHWKDLGEIVLKASACQNMESFRTMADCILRAHVPTGELFSVLRKIINQISALEDCDPVKLAKYTRCLFQAVAPSRDDLAGRLLEEACIMARDAHGTPAAWPSEELEWIASTAYNHCIDMWGQNEMESCTWWAQKAMSIAHFCDDGGHLEEKLQRKYAKLKLDTNGD
ncbi:meiosis protein SPO22/ZIP4 like-domain-containing protein [Diaporthe sp. PMI_573]|nr:meiosis protein SPO22/ZIP4 like-domain-containing protein [Diaporthaceae sp. PMI_573]